jgi:hypothetical protein
MVILKTKRMRDATTWRGQTSVGKHRTVICVLLSPRDPLPLPGEKITQTFTRRLFTAHVMHFTFQQRSGAFLPVSQAPGARQGEVTGIIAPAIMALINGHACSMFHFLGGKISHCSPAASRQAVGPRPMPTAVHPREGPSSPSLIASFPTRQRCVCNAPRRPDEYTCLLALS